MSMTELKFNEEPKDTKISLDIKQENEESVKTRKMHVVKIKIEAEDKIKDDSHNYNPAVCRNQNFNNQKNILLIKPSQEFLRFYYIATCAIINLSIKIS